MVALIVFYFLTNVSATSNPPETTDETSQNDPANPRNYSVDISQKTIANEQVSKQIWINYVSESTTNT